MKSIIKEIYSFLTFYIPIIPSFIENIYYIFNNLKTNNERYSNDLKEGKKILNNIINENYYYVLIDKGIGDTVIVASYAYIFEKKYGKKVAFIVPKNHIDVINKFDYIKKSIALSKEQFNKIVLYISSKSEYQNSKYCYAYFKMKISKNGIRNWSSAEWDKKLVLSKRYKKAIFKMDDKQGKYKIPKTDFDKKVVKKYNISDNSVIINPYANTVTGLKTSFWELLVEKLINNGYDVFTNIGNPAKEKAIKGTKPLNISLNEIYLISAKIKSFIALRSGICEYLALNNTKMIVINKNKKNYDRWDDVNEFSSKKTIRNVYISNKKYDKIILEIMSILDKE